MRSKLLLVFAVMLVFMLYLSGCGSSATCPTCGTTKNGAYGVIDWILVPGHNPTGTPGGPFNSFDISVVDSAHHRFYVSDRIELDVAVIDTQKHLGVNVFEGANGVVDSGINASACAIGAEGEAIPPIVTGLGNFTRFGCRTLNFGVNGFGHNGLFGGFPGAQCCASRANGVNPISGPDGEVLSVDSTNQTDGKVLFVGNGSSSVVAFDVTPTFNNPTAIPTVIAAFPTGMSPDYDGPNGIGPCNVSATGRALSDPTCGDMRADEMAIGVIGTRTILLVANGDPGQPFISLLDVTNILKPTGNFGDDHCLPPAATATTPYGPPLGTAAFLTGNTNINPPRCLLGQIYYDGSSANNRAVNIDDTLLNAANGFTCPFPSVATTGGTPLASGVSGHGGGVNVLGNDIPCHHGPQLNPNGSFCAVQGDGGATPSAGCFGAVALAGLGGSAFNPKTNRFLLSNGVASGADATVGTIDEIDPRLGNPLGPVVVNSVSVPNCAPTSVIQGPPGTNQFLVGCADHDGITFPPNEYILDCSANCKVLPQFTTDKVGGVDEVWYSPADNRYYLAARDMPAGPVLGVIDAGTNQWLVNVPTNSNSHSVAVDEVAPGVVHVFVPLQSGGICGTQASNGCIGVYAQQ